MTIYNNMPYDMSILWIDNPLSPPPLHLSIFHTPILRLYTMSHTSSYNAMFLSYRLPALPPQLLSCFHSRSRVRTFREGAEDGAWEI
jgi:hypothetical protein